MPLDEFLRACTGKLEGTSNRHILDGIGEFLTPSQKDWAKAKLREDTIALLRLRLGD